MAAVMSHPEDRLPHHPIFGLYGDFAGDAEKKAAALALKERLLNTAESPVSRPSSYSPQSSTPSSAVTVREVVNVLESLPFSGRICFATTVLCLSPERERLVRELYDWCFEPEQQQQSQSKPSDGYGEDDDFVMIGSDGTEYVNTSRYHILRVVVAMLPHSCCGTLSCLSTVGQHHFSRRLFTRHGQSHAAFFRR